MTRENLIRAIYNNTEDWSCPGCVFDKPEVECCKKCAENLLVEYEKQIKSEEREKIIAEISREIRLLYANEYEQQIRAEVIEEVKEKLNNSGAEITFNLPVEEILGEDIDLDDFAMLVQDAVQVYRKMVLGVLEQLKEQK